MLNLTLHRYCALSLFNDFDNLQRTLSLSASLYGLSPPSASARPTRGFFPAPTAECFSPLLPSPPTNLTVVPSRHVTRTGLKSVATDTTGEATDLHAVCFNWDRLIGTISKFWGHIVCPFVCTVCLSVCMWENLDSAEDRTTSVTHKCYNHIILLL